MISPEKIAEWKALEAIATPGPWEVIPDGKSHRVINPAGDAELGNWTVAGDVWWLTNAAFIAAAREAVPKLIADRAALLAEREELGALLLASDGILVDAPALAVKERTRAEAAEASLAEARAENERLTVLKNGYYGEAATAYDKLNESKAENEQLRKGLRRSDYALREFRNLVKENANGVPRYTIDSGAALNSAIEESIDPTLRLARALLEDKK